MRAAFASQNPNKLAELREVLPGWLIEPIEAADWPEETGESYYENALLKARFGRRVGGAGEWVLGEDSGIECEALDGAPGLHSARWAPGLDQADALMDRLERERDRRARMVSELVCLTPDGRELRGRGVMEGEIALERRGSAGFGYDPIFIPAGDTRTVAEIGDEWKRQNSHRAKAARMLAEALRVGA